MISIAEFSKKKNISEEKAIELIREGLYSGRVVDGEWFVDEINSARQEPDYGFFARQLWGPFAKGCLAGLLISIIFGLLTYPWERPNFEGAAGYHFLMMIYAVPILTLGSGILYWLFRKLFKRAND